MLFIIANIIMVPLGILCIKAAKQILKVPRRVLMPLILVFCIVGTFAINNSVFDIGVMLAAGVIAYLLEENGFPIAPAILGVVLGGMLEENFITSHDQGRGQPAGVRGPADRSDTSRRHRSRLVYADCDAAASC